MEDKLNKNKKEEKFLKITKLAISISLCLILFLSIYLILKKSGALDKIDSPEELSEIIRNFGIFSRIIFIIVQFLQVTFLPLPGFVTTLAGSLVFGPYEASLMSFIAIMLGSIFAFWLGKVFGTKVLIWAIGKEDAEKWKAVLTEGKYAFFLMMCFPVFPDDVLCMVAGVTNMSYKFFIITNLISRPLAILSTCFIGSGYLIPFKGWGIYVWIALIMLLIIAFLIACKYQKTIEKIISNIDKKLSNKFKHRKLNKNELIEEKTLTTKNLKKNKE